MNMNVNLKGFYGLLIAGVLSLSLLAGCGGGDGASGNANDKTTTVQGNLTGVSGDSANYTIV